MFSNIHEFISHNFISLNLNLDKYCLFIYLSNYYFWEDQMIRILFYFYTKIKMNI